MKIKNCIVLTPDKLAKLPIDRPVICLSGPGTNAPDWHSEVISFFLQKDERVIIVSPRKNLIPLIDISLPELPDGYEKFATKLEWEEYYLTAAATSEKGCILFWLVGEKLFRSRNVCNNPACNTHLGNDDLPERENPTKSYSFMTQYQLGRWVGKSTAKIVVGSDGTYPEWKDVEYDLLQERPDLTIHPNIEALCEAALAMAA